MILYFSATGNSQYCAEWLADHRKDDLMDTFYYIRHGIAAELQSETPWVFVMPTYCWQIPRVVEDFILSGHFSGSREAYFVMTCGSEVGDVEPKLRDLCQHKGMNYCGTLPVVMPDNYLVFFTPPSQDQARIMRRKAEDTLEQGIGYMNRGESFPPIQTKGLDHLKSGVVNRAFYRFHVKANKFYAKDSCVGCGKCEHVCPMGNICLEQGKPVWGSSCTHCMACICKCPVEAIEYGKGTRKKQRYLCPPYQGREQAEKGV